MSKYEAKGGSALIVHCGACGSEFEKTRDWQVFCSDTCRKDSWKSSKLNARRLMQTEANLVDHERRLSQLEAAMGTKKEEA
jgi:hypothetical protein